MKYIFANWKMYLNNEESLALAREVATIVLPDGVIGAIFPTLLSFREVRSILEGADFSVGVQNIDCVPKGAYTGAISAVLCQEAGAKYALVGHSERRHIFGEKDEDVKRKIEACDNAGLIPVVCIGETAEDLSNGKRQ